MSEWREIALGEAIELKRGYDLPSAERRSGSVPIISSSGESGLHSEAKVKGPGVVTGRYGTIGEVFLVESDFWPLNTSLYVRDFKGNDVRFIYYLLKTVNWNQYNDKSGVPGINRNHVHEARVKVPSLAEQQAVAHVLGALDAKIKRNCLTSQTLEAMARLLFRDWFIDYGPVRFKMDGRAPYLESNTWNLFPASLDGDNKPQGWIASSIGEEVKVVGGSTPSTKEPAYWDGGKHFWATPKDLSSLKSPVLLSTDRKVTNKGLSQISSGLLPIGTVLLSSRAPIGYMAIAEVPTAINQGFIAMKCEKDIPNLFVLFWCKERMDLILGNANGSTFQEISKSNFRPIPVVVPPKLVIDAFMAATDPMYQTIVANLRENIVLSSLRDSLLRKIMSGGVGVVELEKMVGVAL